MGMKEAPAAWRRAVRASLKAEGLGLEFLLRTRLGGGDKPNLYVRRRACAEQHVLEATSQHFDEFQVCYFSACLREAAQYAVEEQLRKGMFSGKRPLFLSASRAFREPLRNRNVISICRQICREE